MARKYLRRVRVTFGEFSDLVIEDLLIKFRVRREATATPAEGEINIYNLNQSNETRIKERGRRVTLLAGYGDAMETIFDGDVRRIERYREGQDRITRVHVGGNVQKITRAVFNKSYEGEVAVRQIITDAVETLDLDLGPLDLIPEDLIETNFSYRAGKTWDLIKYLLQPHGIRGYEDDGVVRFSRLMMTADDRPEGITISEQTGMIGTPTTTDDGISVKTLLDHRLKIDTRIQIESSVLDQGASGDLINNRADEQDSGLWKVVEVTHAGDNREGEFTTSVEGRPIA